MQTQITVKKLTSRSRRTYKSSAREESSLAESFPVETQPQASGRPADPEIIHVGGGEVAKRDALAAPKYAASLQVADQPTLDHANSFLRSVKTLAAEIAATFDPHIAKAHEAHKSLLAEKKRFLEPLDDAERIVKRTIGAYLKAEDDKHRAAELARSEAETKARLAAQEAVEAAKEAEASGDQETADKIVDEAYDKLSKALDQAPAVPEAPRAQGLLLTEVWKFQIIDKSLLPREYLIPDEVRIGRIVRAMKAETAIPGVRVYSETSVASRC